MLKSFKPLGGVSKFELVSSSSFRLFEEEDTWKTSLPTFHFSSGSGAGGGCGGGGEGGLLNELADLKGVAVQSLFFCLPSDGWRSKQQQQRLEY